MADQERHIQDIEYIIQQLGKEQAFADLYYEPTPYQHPYIGEIADIRRFRDTMGINISKAVRGEDFTDPETVKAVDAEVERLRNFVLANGGVHPKGSPDFFLKSGANELAANNRDTSFGRLMLTLHELQSHLVTARLGFSFHQTFKLDIEFYDPNNSKKNVLAAYHSGLQPLTAMTGLEGRLIPHYLATAADTFAV